MNTFDYSVFGGKPLYRGGDTVWNFGIANPDTLMDQPTTDPLFEPLGKEWDDGRKRFLAWEHTGGFDPQHFWGLWQQEGSCVMQGAMNVTRFALAIEANLMGQPGRVVLPCLLPTYAKSRQFAGLNDRGDGSSGDTMAKALTEVGWLPFDSSHVPQPTFDEKKGVYYGSKNELDWSQGQKIPQAVLDACQPWRFGGKTRVKTVEAGRLLLLHGKVQTVASDWGGRMQCKVVSDPPVLLNDHAGTWHHQQSYLACFEHPKLGWLYWREQSWQPTAHGFCPTAKRGGGFWVVEKDYKYDVTRGQVWAFTRAPSFYPAQFSHTV